MIKHYHPQKYREKFRRYRMFHSISLLLFAIGFLGEFFLYGSAGFSLLLTPSDTLNLFLPLFCAEGLLYLLIFFFGLTLYSPFFTFLFSLFRGALSAFCLAATYTAREEKGGILLFAFTLFYIFSSAYLFLGYSTFCTVASLHIYSPKDEKGKGKREFGGTLFRSTYFCGKLNLRFLSTYCLLFFAAFFFASLLAFFYAYLRFLFGI